MDRILASLQTMQGGKWYWWQYLHADIVPAALFLPNFGTELDITMVRPL